MSIIVTLIQLHCMTMELANKIQRVKQIIAYVSFLT